MVFDLIRFVYREIKLRLVDDFNSPYTIQPYLVPDFYELCRKNNKFKIKITGKEEADINRPTKQFKLQNLTFNLYFNKQDKKELKQFIISIKNRNKKKKIYDSAWMSNCHSIKLYHNFHTRDREKELQHLCDTISSVTGSDNWLIRYTHYFAEHEFMSHLIAASMFITIIFTKKKYLDLFRITLYSSFNIKE